jgi:WD40 repeat protein
MRVIDAFDQGVQAIAVSPDGRFLAAASPDVLTLWDWSGGDCWRAKHPNSLQLAFSSDGTWLAAGNYGYLRVFPTDGRLSTRLESPRRDALLAGGVSFAPTGKYLVASRDRYPGGPPDGGGLLRWQVPTWKQELGFDHDWPAFPRLASSPNGEYVAGINNRVCEVRFAVSGGIQCRVRNRERGGQGYLTFSPDSQMAVCGWEAELHVVELIGGKVTRVVRTSGPPFRDVAYTGNGQHVGTVDSNGQLRLWETTEWREVRAFDWAAGPLTSLAFTTDGLTGVCGTVRGQLILFDLD